MSSFSPTPTSPHRHMPESARCTQPVSRLRRCRRLTARGRATSAAGPLGPPLIAVAALCLLGSTGCSSSRSDGKWFQKPKSSQDYLDMALEGQSGDERRRGVIGLADSRDGKTEWAMKVLDTIARTDVNAAVRCAAIAAMVPASGAEQVPTALNILSSDSERIEGTRTAPGAVRWEAAKLLLSVIERYSYEESQRGKIVQVLLERMAVDKDRNVRLTAMEALSYFPEPPIPSALVDVMEEDDFALQHGAERALIALTGQTHHHDPKAWRKWIAETPDLFKDMGRTPPEIQSADSKTIRWEWPW